MKKKICLVCVLAFFAAGSAGAVPQNITLGPCNVTFDLGFDESVYGLCTGVVHSETYDGSKYDEYSFLSYELVHSETYDGAKHGKFYSPSHDMDIIVRSFVDPDRKWSERSADEWGFLLSLAMPDTYISVVPREIDGNMGCIIMPAYTDGRKAYMARYNVLNDTIEVVVWSTYSWDEGTTNLLNSIHIEKVVI